MAKSTREAASYPYQPDVAIPPGATLQETIDALGMTQADLAARTGRAPKTINEIVQGKAPITSETAIQFERALGVPASFWNNLERNYRARVAELEARRRLEGWTDWLKLFPVPALVQRGILPRVRDRVLQVEALLSFFGVASPQAWQAVWSEAQVAFRRSRAFQSSQGALSAWLRLGELEGQKVECPNYDKAKFRSALAAARALTEQAAETIESELKRCCAQAGVVVAFVPELPGTFVCGATRWLSPDRALIQLSLRHKSDDHLWFGFFHEAGHILRHGKKSIFVDERESSDDDEEREADEFARDHLLPPADYRAFVSFGDFSEHGIRQFARSVRIAPGIVVGRLQHDGHISYSSHNRLKKRYEWVEAG